MKVANNEVTTPQLVKMLQYGRKGYGIAATYKVWGDDKAFIVAHLTRGPTDDGVMVFDNGDARKADLDFLKTLN